MNLCFRMPLSLPSITLIFTSISVFRVLPPRRTDMHQHMPSSTLTLKFPESKNIKDESESESETDFDIDSDREHEFQEKVVVGQLKKQKLDLDGGSGSKMMLAAASGGGSGGAALLPLVCKVEKCNSDLKECKQYHKKHRVCEFHAKAQAASVDGLMQRFCQQCSRFHELAEFDETKRSCRRRLQGHNARRRKSSTEAGLAPKKDDCRIVEERGRINMVFPKNQRNLHIH